MLDDRWTADELELCVCVLPPLLLCGALSTTEALTVTVAVTVTVFAGAQAAVVVHGCQSLLLLLLLPCLPPLTLAMTVTILVGTAVTVVVV